MKPKFHQFTCIKHAIEEMHEHGQKHKANRGNLT